MKHLCSEWFQNGKGSIMNKLFALFLIVTGFGAVCLADLHPDRIVEYKKTSNGTLSLHIFNPPNHQSTNNTPSIVFFFGGGWTGGSPSQFYNQSAYFASRGIVAICAEYRVKKTHGTSPKVCVQDGKSAFRWIRIHARELGINPDKLAAGGGSAGGHVAAATGTVSGLNEKGEDTSISCCPNALVLFNPVFDNSPDGYGHNRVAAYWEAFSPLHNIDQNTPPTIVFLGTEDKLIPVKTAKKYKHLMEKAGRRCDLHLYEDQPHGFFNSARYYETVFEADKFLCSLGYLKGEPTLRKK
jgi:acetyl esterase/lipase